MKKEDIDAALSPLRAQIDTIDAKMIDLLAERYRIVREVAVFKAQNDIAVVQPARAKAVQDRAVALGESAGLNPAFVRSLWSLLIAHAHAIEHYILKNV